MQQRLSKLEAAQRLVVSPSTLDRMIRRGELEVEREGRGDRAKVWVLAPGLSSDAPGGRWLRVCTPHTVQDLAAASPDRIHIWSTSPTIRLADGMHQQLQELPGLGWPR